MDDLRLPAEWEQQDAVLLTWPGRTSDWREMLEEIELVYIELVRHIGARQRLIITSDDVERVAQRLRRSGAASSNISLYACASDDTWARDFGPITVYNGEQAQLHNFTFNGWGGKFPAARDNSITAELARQQAFACPLEHHAMVLEGGSIDSDGHGSVLTTSACLLNPNRNPHLNKEQIEDYLARRLGIKRLLWLDYGYLAGDDTDSHIDTLARFAPDDTIIYTACNDSGDQHYRELRAMERQLRCLRSANGRPYNLLPLPWPQARFDADGQRLPATYANFLVINQAVLVPTYADPADAAALEVIAAAFPTREIIAIDCRTVIRQHGSLHCLTMQLHRGTLP